MISAEADAEHAQYLSNAGLVFYVLVILAVIWFARFDVWKVGPDVARSDAASLLQFLLALGTIVLMPVLAMAGRNLWRWRRDYGLLNRDHWRLDAARSTWRSALLSFVFLVLLYVVVDVVPLALYVTRS